LAAGIARFFREGFKAGLVLGVKHDIEGVNSFHLIGDSMVYGEELQKIFHNNIGGK